MAADKVRDGAALIHDSSVHQAMLLQDRRVTIGDASAYQALIASTFNSIHNAAGKLQSTVSSFSKTANHVAAVFTMGVGRGMLDAAPSSAGNTQQAPTSPAPLPDIPMSKICLLDEVRYLSKWGKLSGSLTVRITSSHFTKSCHIDGDCLVNIAPCLTKIIFLLCLSFFPFSDCPVHVC